MTMSRKLFFLASATFLFFSCNDGNLAIETISFDNQEVISCTKDTTATFLFKYNASQALILTLPQNVLKNKKDSIKTSLSTDYKLFYRTFNGSVNESYFCGSYPPVSPSVISQFEATGGTLYLVTQPIYDEKTNEILRYDHIITIKDLVILNSEGNKLIDSNFNFGIYKTKK